MLRSRNKPTNLLFLIWVPIPAPAALQRSLEEGRSEGDHVTIRLQNITLMNQKAFAYLADQTQQEETPQACVLLECHLRGVELNKA